MAERKKFLIVDDSEIIRNSLKNFFKDYNLEVISAVNGLDGIQKTAVYNPDLIILDLMMPDLDGLKMLQVIKVLEGIKGIPVIVISANTEKKNVIAAIEAGAQKVITKPLQKEIIIKAVNEIFGDNFLSKKPGSEYLSEIEKMEMKKEFTRFFLNHFPARKESILKAITEKDKTTLHSIVHEFKGAGGTIGYTKITDMSAEIEYKLQFSEIDWTYISLKCEQLIQFIKNLASKEIKEC